MSSPTGSASSSGRRNRPTIRTHSQENQALTQIAREAEARLAARRASRAEAREIRMRELEKQAKENEEKQDRHYGLTKNEHTRPVRATHALARKDSEDSSSTDDTRDVRRELNEMEEKYKKAMMNNATLDNEKQTYRYQVDLLKDQIEEMEEELIELRRQHKDRCRQLDAQKRDYKDLKTEATFCKEQLVQRDQLIEEYGLVFVSSETVEDEKDGKKKKKEKEKKEKAALVTPASVHILALAEGTLDDRLKKFSSDKETLREEVKRLKQLLEEEKERSALAEKYASPKPQVANGPDMQLYEVQMEAQKQMSDYKFKLKKAEQDITQLEGNVIRLESQVKRYKTASESSEKVEEELKQERRKLQRELRESQNQIEEVQNQNHHLQKRLEKLKSARSALSKQ